MKRSFKKFITTNPWLKLASLVLAAILWFFVVSKGRSVIVMDVPVGFKNIPPNLEIVNGAETVSVNIKGQERLLKKLKQEDVSVIIDLNNAAKGNKIYPLSTDSVMLPNTFTATEISPQAVKLHLEEKVRKRVPVRPIIIGSPAQGFSIKKVEVVPRMIEIAGPESLIAKIYSVKTEQVDITGVNSDLQFRVYLDITRKNVKVENPEVEVKVVVRGEGR